MSTCILFSTTLNCHVQSHNLEQSEFWHQCGRLICHSTTECVNKINLERHCVLRNHNMLGGGLRSRSAFLVFYLWMWSCFSNFLWCVKRLTTYGWNCFWKKYMGPLIVSLPGLGGVKDTLTLQKPQISTGSVGHLARKEFS